MQMRTKLPIVFLVGAGTLLLVALAVIFTFRAQTAFAQDGPLVEINLNFNNGITEQGQSVAQYTFSNFNSITCDVECRGAAQYNVH